MKTKHRIIATIVGLLVLLGVGVTKSFMGFVAQENQRAGFSSHIDTYLKADITPQTSEAPYLRGKLVTIDVDRAEVDYWTYPKLPDDIRALSPDQVQTIGLIQWGWDKVGHYEDVKTGQETGDALQSHARLTLIDWVDKTCIAERTFEGDAPLKGLTRDGDFKSMQPMFQIVDYLGSLPRR